VNYVNDAHIFIIILIYSLQSLLQIIIIIITIIIIIIIIRNDVLTCEKILEANNDFQNKNDYRIIQLYIQ